MSKEKESLPNAPSELAGWFAEAVQAEITALQKDGGEQSYELLSGKLVEAIQPDQGIFQFIIADGTRLPEDATGKLKTQSDEYSTSVIAQLADRIHLEIESKGPLPAGIPRATLIIDDTALLRKLADILEDCKANPTKLNPLSSTVFHPKAAHVGSVNLTGVSDIDALDNEKKFAIEQACGSSVTYIWGPPGTGKTHVIARLVAALLERGERVLVTSHTHAAVDQALYAAVKKGYAGEVGPLSESAFVTNGLMLRVGLTKDEKIPDSVRLDKVLESKAKDLETMIAQLEKEAEPLAKQRAAIRPQLEAWESLLNLKDQLEAEKRNLIENERKIKEVGIALDLGRGLLQKRRGEVEQAQRSWFFRAKKMENATRALQVAQSDFLLQETRLTSLDNKARSFNETFGKLERAVASQEDVCKEFTSLEELKRQESTFAQKLNAIEEKINELQSQILDLENKLINGARAVFCTLTKLYMGKELAAQNFDAVIIDEISMALPPLILLAAGRATSRVILVGDWMQLPPIIRSDSEISNTRLREDTFHLAGIANSRDPVDCKILARLRTQRRMLPQIADVARHLAYGPDGIRDHLSVRERKPQDSFSFLPESPLVIVDTAELHCWSGKQPGNRSRFNFYSAMLSVELAAMAAHGLPEPKIEGPPPIGIVTPFAAQRRLISKLVGEMGLNKWVAVGTVHTFQGGQANLIIFDCVLDEPHWSARLCNPKSTEEALRDLNVAVTRTQNKFVFVGSSDWLNAHAKASSGLGQLWSFLKDHAALVSAIELVEKGFVARVSQGSTALNGWQMPFKTEVSDHDVLQIFDETNFFDAFAADIQQSSKSVFGLVPYFGEYRWPRMQPLFAAALERGVEVTLVMPPPSEAENKEYVEKAIKNLREQGAVVVPSSGLHGKDIIIDEHILYTGSLNWASHRGRAEIMHRIDSSGVAKLALKYVQAKYIREAGVHPDGSPRTCPDCGGPIRIVNQRVQTQWDFQTMKVGCMNYLHTKCKYLRDLGERAPFTSPPICQVDGQTKYQCKRRGKGERWECPKHPRQCTAYKVVPGDLGQTPVNRSSQTTLMS